MSEVQIEAKALDRHFSKEGIRRPADLTHSSAGPPAHGCRGPPAHSSARTGHVTNQHVCFWVYTQWNGKHGLTELSAPSSAPDTRMDDTV